MLAFLARPRDMKRWETWFPHLWINFIQTFTEQDNIGGVTAAGGPRRRQAQPVLAKRSRQAPVSGKVFIQQDDSSTTHCQLQTKESRIDRQQFEETVRTLNNLYAEAEKLGGQSYLEGCLACLTAYTIFLCMETHYEKVSQPLFSQNLLKS